MLRTLRPWLTYSNVTATIALFAALGCGTALAATTVLEGRLLRNGSVTAAKLATDSVTTIKLASGSVTTTKLATGSVTSARVRDGSLGVSDLSAAARDSLRGQAGADGAQGPVGPQGIQGPAGTAPAEEAADWSAVLPQGALLRGAYAMTNNCDAAGACGIGMRDAVSYGGRKMPTAMTPYLVPAGALAGDVPQCPGTLVAPDASEGALCIYIGAVVGASYVSIADPADPLSNRQYNLDGTPNIEVLGVPQWGTNGDTTGPFGASIFGSPASTNTHELVGTWAARAAAAP